MGTWKNAFFLQEKPCPSNSAFGGGGYLGFFWGGGGGADFIFMGARIFSEVSDFKTVNKNTRGPGKSNLVFTGIWNVLKFYGTGDLNQCWPVWDCLTLIRLSPFIGTFIFGILLNQTRHSCTQISSCGVNFHLSHLDVCVCTGVCVCGGCVCLRAHMVCVCVSVRVRVCVCVSVCVCALTSDVGVCGCESLVSV